LFKYLSGMLWMVTYPFLIVKQKGSTVLEQKCAHLWCENVCEN
jgi:hypothetical protein